MSTATDNNSHRTNTRPKIRPLPKDVVDRIAAGEVVQRPVSVVKELLENSLDADATQIDISCQRGGLESIAVTDDGVGIHPRDLTLACTRFATSKLMNVDDMNDVFKWLDLPSPQERARGRAASTAEQPGCWARHALL